MTQCTGEQIIKWYTDKKCVCEWSRVKRGEEEVLYSLVFSTYSIIIMLLLLLLFPFLFLARTNQSFRIVFLPLVNHVWELNEDKGEAGIRITKKKKIQMKEWARKAVPMLMDLMGLLKKGENVFPLPGLQSWWAAALKHACRGWSV